MRKLWLTFTAMLLCSIASFAQTEIWTPEDFKAIPNNATGSYILKADIDLGDLGTLTEAVIPNFKGTFDGAGHTITYNASFSGTDHVSAWSDGTAFGLFGIVNGSYSSTATIKYLNVQGTVTLSGTESNMDVSLLCGRLGNYGVIEYCNAIGDINSTVNSESGGGSDAGLLVGQSSGIVRYCIGKGNVVGVGYAGGLIGQMKSSASVLACSFTGSVTANNPKTTTGPIYGSFAGGICGFASDNSSLEFCAVDANVNGIKVTSGIASTSTSPGSPDVENSYATGNVNGNAVHDTTMTNSNGTTIPTYYEGEMIADSIVAKLNRVIPTAEKNKFYFDVINGEVVLIIGQRQTAEEVYTYYRTKMSGAFNSPTTWQAATSAEGPWVDNIAPKQNTTAYITISTGDIVTVEHNLVITGSYYITANNGVIKITQQGQLINETNDNVPGIVEIVSPQKVNQAWTFIGAPFKTGYKLGTIKPVPGTDADGIIDISVKKYDYTTANWRNDWAWVGTTMKAGEGYFGFPFSDGAITFTTYGDICTWNDEEGRYVIGSYNFDNTPATSLNNGDVPITETISATQDDPETGVIEEGNLMALSNPYPAKLKASKFISDNGGSEVIQGNCVYVFKNGAFGMPSNDEIAMTEGFFVNFNSTGTQTITFKKGQMKDYPSSKASSKASANEFIKLTLINGDKKVRAYLAHNEEAEQGYDIFDANKMFAPTEIAEPYFVTDGIALMKEEFAELPYYATMNVRSFADDTVSFVVENIPEGLSVSIIDGENIIDMVEGGVYSTEILTGENADRFKVLIKKSVSISDVEELEVNITNNNRHISIATTETDLQVEVYNALGQKVLSTKDRNFTLNQVSAGAYLIKAFNNKASKTQKIVVE
jgi:hypothetical protein